MKWRDTWGDVFTGIRRNKSMAASVVLVTMISMYLLGAGLLAQRQVTAMKGYWYDRVQVTVYLCTDSTQSESCEAGAATKEQKAAIAAELDALKPLVKKVYFESSSQAYAQFKKQFQDSPMATDIREGDIPESYRVQLSDPGQFQKVTDALATAPGVASVQDQRKVLQKIFRWINVITVCSLSLAGLMLIAAVLLMATTIRQAAHSRRREIGIMRLVGASNATIRTPFILEVGLAGLTGALIAVGLLAMTVRLLFDNYVGNSVSTAVVGMRDLAFVAPVLVGVVLVLAAFTSVFTLWRFLRV